MSKETTSQLTVAGIGALLLVLIGCSSANQSIDLPGDGIYNPYEVPVDAMYEIKSATIPREGKSQAGETEKIPSGNIYIDENRQAKEPEKIEPQPASKISPVLREWLDSKEAGDSVEIIVTFVEDQRMPLLPELETGADREKGGTRRQAAIDKLKEARKRSQDRALDALGEYGGFEPTEGFWIVNSVAGVARLGDVERLAEAQQVVYLQPVEGGEKPPQDANNNNDAQDGRARIASDPYFNLGLTNPWIGLMDTGVRESHEMFEAPDHIAWMRDCVNGGPNCNNSANPGYDPSDFAWNHGTRTAGILTGNSRRGNAFRGVTEIRTDSWQIYSAAGLNTTAAVRAIQAGVAAFDKVLVGEIQASESETGTIATAADNAYDTGVIIVSANGNFGPNSSTVRSPGIAHKVLGVGGFMTDGGAQYVNQGRGPATDGRFKPDIQTPTWSETASNTSDTALGVFTGTSGATPYASAAAMLARNWLRQFGTFDNGQTYAFMILYGQNEWPYDNTVGAGPLEMATNGWAWWGKVGVTHNMTIDIPINVGAGKQNFDVALWWPESAAQAHNDIDIHLIDPSGVERSRGYSGVSIFERAGAGGALQVGTWTVRLRGFDVNTGSQTVYWAAHIRN
ncbi:MAG: S8 family serine peptidase [Acidobacteria bacterium]|nr:S8 family serine peptidase [Acidobacteriota bacterium]